MMCAMPLISTGTPPRRACDAVPEPTQPRRTSRILACAAACDTSQMRRRYALCVMRLAWLRGATVLVLTLMVVGRAVPATAQVTAPPPATRNHAAGRPDLFIEV